MTYIIFIYSDYGSSDISVRHFEQSMRDLYPTSKLIKVSGKDIQAGKLMQLDDSDSNTSSDKIRSKLLCIGGGFDLGYLASLGEHGCNQIRKFVSEGGNYLGICAGAYFACSRIEFDRNGPLEVVGERWLKFFDGHAIGPCNKKFKYNSDEETKSVQVKIEGLKAYNLYMNGGCYFKPNACCADVRTIGKYIIDENDDDPQSFIECLNDSIAIAATTYGKGNVLLSGIHFEFDADNLNLAYENIAKNVHPKLKSNEIGSSLKIHSNEFLIKHLFKTVFLFD